jgi:hypothetical protein
MSMSRLAILVLLCCSVSIVHANPASPRHHAPFPAAVPEGLDYNAAYFPAADYDETIPTPESLLGFPAGQRTASPAEISAAFRAWADASPRATLVEYARSYEGRPLVYMVITAPDRQDNLDEIKAGLAKIADPRSTPQAERGQLLDKLPGVAWLAYSIHGNETSGSDAALVTAYHLLADQSDATTTLLDDLVVILDPNMNPDGRARFYQQTSEYRGMVPNVDDQSLVHSGYWPWGRMSHYLFDLNRDWIYGTHPETRGRIRAASDWHPLLFVDAHEMGAQNTYLFSPAREPHNPNFMPGRNKWAQVFASDQAKAFDEYNWPYYSGEWNEGWYPGYSDAWASFRGAQGILYEQARIADDGVRQANGKILSYRESVHHQALSSIANLRTLQVNYREMLREFHADREKLLAAGSPYGNRVFAVTPTDNRGRLQAFLELMELQDFEVYRSNSEITQAVTDQLGRERRVTLPAGTLLIPNRQPQARLLAAMLEFDPRISESALQTERTELVRNGGSTIYDTTAWNITMMFGLEAYEVDMRMPGNAERVSVESLDGAFDNNDDAIAWAINGIDDRAVAAAARLLSEGIKVRVTNKETTLDNVDLPRGSVFINLNDNRNRQDVIAKLDEVADTFGVVVHTVTAGLGEGDLPDIGGEHFRLLERPRVALLARGSVSPYDFGATWYMLDHRLALAHSHIGERYLNTADLRRYNVLILPDRWGDGFDEAQLKALKSWVEAGGTLIATGGAAASIAKEEAGISQVRQLPDTFDDLKPYRLAILREWMAGQSSMPSLDAVWAHSASSAIDPPWSAYVEEKPADADELKQRDEWQRIFMPQGALMATRTDQQHWLTFGAGETLPVLYGNDPVLMSTNGIETPIRMGMFHALGETSGLKLFSSRDDDAKPQNIGWAPMPTGQDLRLRMSGLLWPEAAQRIANSAYVTRESIGRGQVILFAASPVVRGATLGTSRILENAIVYGPGLGTRTVIIP